MGGIFLLFFTVLILLAIFLNADFVLILLYLMAGTYVLSHWWSRRAARAVTVHRSLVERAFFGEIVDVSLEARNQSRLPVVWLHLRETLPMELAPRGETQGVVYLGAKSRGKLHYTLDCRRRGYYPIGPLSMFSGDLLGLSGGQHLAASANYLTVYPRIVPLTSVVLPTHSPMGTLRHVQPIFEDPSRVRGKRDYIPGDSLRRVDWKASAIARRLQIKLFEPSIALETMIFLNLNRREMEIKDLSRETELGVVVAASVANWVVRVRQSVGLSTNGIDPLAGANPPPALPPRRGRGHLMRLLEILARIQNGETFPFVQLIQQEAYNLSWGTSLIIVTNHASDDMFDALFQARRRGLEAVLILCGFVAQLVEIERKAAFFGFPIYHFLTEQDLNVWKV